MLTTGFMTRLFTAGLLLICCVSAAAHNIGSTPVTWNREISRLVYDRCASCHRPGGTAFSMMSFTDVQPRAAAIKDAVLSRRMPPWGAIKGFGDFRNDQALTQEQIEIITDWIQNDTPRGNNRRALPREPTFAAPAPDAIPAHARTISGSATTLDQPLLLDGLFPEQVSPGQSARIVATFPDGHVEPLVWLHGYEDRYRHAFLFRKAIRLPAGTVIRGVPPGAVIALLP